ncbi:MAG: hypothetical protein E7Z87_01715 [Cyanobacteria bacterium SIG26]|nr:hypothetical protein [Cyanobacteria bacterium SIG26]
MQNERKTYNEFLKKLGFSESSGNYRAVNSSGYLGKYQMGEMALVEAGYYKPKNRYNNKWDGTFTGKNGVYSKEDFLNNPQAQEKAIIDYQRAQWKDLKRRGLEKYLWKEVNGIRITPAAMLAGSHLKGPSNVHKYLKNNGRIADIDRVDGYGTSIDSYMDKFSNYDVSNITGITDPNDTYMQILGDNYKNPTPRSIMYESPQGQATGYAAPVEDTINQNNFKSHATFTPESLVGGNSSRSYTTFTPESLVGGGNQRINTSFTPEEIGRMSPQEFARNEKAIMQQLKNGQIKPSSAPNVDFESFKNPENGKSTIFTREDIEKMSTKEFTKNEKAINAQMNSVGIPYKKEVPTGTTTYTKEKAKTAASSSSGSSTDGNGRWVTINGNHVFLEKEK